MRIVAGKYKRTNLKTPEGDEITRPTKDMVREALFSSITVHNETLFLDLFAGSGAIGIEALSRGAKHAYFVENNKEAANCIAQNLIHTHLEDRGTLLKQDVVLALRNIREKEVDIVYMDPPYHQGEYLRTLNHLMAMPWVTVDTLILAECSADEDIQAIEETGFQVIREKNYKTNRHLFIQKRREEE